MGYKNNDSCLDAVADDEPIFVLRAQDETAAGLVDAWAEGVLVNYRVRGLTPSAELIEKLTEARAHADVMRAWPKQKLPGQKFDGADR